MSSIPYSRHHDLHRQARMPDTCDWLLSSPDFVDWKSSSSSTTFLLHGIPGCGKTIVTSKVIDQCLAEHSQKQARSPFAYFYCADCRQESARSSPEEILRSILRQLTIPLHTKRQVHSVILTEYEMREAEAKSDGFDIPKLSTSECARFILDIVSSDPITIIIDAIDEVQPDRRFDLINALESISRESSNVVKVFLTSRDDQSILRLLPGAIKLAI